MPIEPGRLWRLLRWAVLAAVVVVGLLCLLFLVVGREAFAQQPICDDRDAVAAQLRDGFGEHLIGVGIVPATAQRASGLMSLYANRESGTWTITITAVNPRAPSGFASCIAGSGEGFRLAPTEHPDT